jgi:hypothetical protein
MVKVNGAIAGGATAWINIPGTRVSQPANISHGDYGSAATYFMQNGDFVNH